MIEWLVNFLQTNVLPWGAWGVFLASVIEEVAAPIPSALVMAMSGFLLVSGPVSFDTISALIFKVAIPAAIGVTLGSYAVYFVARFGGRFLIEKWGKYIGLYWSDIEKMQSKLSGTRKDEILIGVARVLPIVPSVAISAFCGILEMNIFKYFVISVSGLFFRGLILGAIGWQAGNVYEKYASLFSKAESVFLVSTILFSIVFIVLKYRSRLRK
jgi:membrane protein DedA with SNARE-associated domain